MMKRLLTLGAIVAATPAAAHHPLNGMPMETFTHGLLSGVGHPVLGFDHLFFVVAMGVAAVFTAQKMLAPLAYIGAMLLGCLLMYSGIAMPAAEVFIVGSLLTLGYILATGRALALPGALIVFAAFGLFHGSAFGGSVAGEEGRIGGAVLAGYLLGLAAIQYAIALGAGKAATALGAANAGALNARLVGAAVAGVGLFLALEMAEGPILAALVGAGS